MALKLNWEDRLLGMRAVEKRFITEKQLTKCLNIIEFGGDQTRKLTDILLQEGLITPAQLKRLHEDLIKDTSSTGDADTPSYGKKRFGEIALEQNMITNDQLQEALDEQEKFLARGVRVQLGQILYKKGYLTLPQVARIVEAQSKKALYCKNCQTNSVINNYESSKIYQCEKCNWDLIPAKVSKPVMTTDADDDDEEDSEDLGTLDILEL